LGHLSYDGLKILVSKQLVNGWLSITTPKIYAHTALLESSTTMLSQRRAYDEHKKNYSWFMLICVVLFNLPPATIRNTS